MYNAIRNARVNDKFQEPLYLFLELVRAGVMHGHLWTIGASSGGPSFGTGVSFLNERRYAIFSSVIAEEKSSMLLVMRVLSIVPLGFKVRCLLFAFALGCRSRHVLVQNIGPSFRGR